MLYRLKNCVYCPNLGKNSAKHLLYYKEKIKSDIIILISVGKEQTFSAMSTVQSGQKAQSVCLKSAENRLCLYVLFGKC